MLHKLPINGNSKQILLGVITLQIYIIIGVCRSYVAFLFYQLDMADSKIHLNDDQKLIIASRISLITPFGSLASGVLMDMFGRRTCILLMFAPFVISWTMISEARSYSTLVNAMIIESIALGMGTSCITYVTEISTTKYRGLLLAMINATMNLGIILCSYLMYILKWNVASIIFVAMSAGGLLLALILPESPVWLYSKGQKQRAIDILGALRSQKPNELEDEIKDMENSFTSISARTGIFETLKTLVKAWRQFSITLLFFLLLILNGPSILSSYFVFIIDRFRLPYDSATIVLIYSFAGFCGSFLAPVFVHNLKRKAVLTISSLGMFVSMLAISVYENFYLETINKPLPWIVPFYVCIFTLSSNIGVLPLGFIISGELFPLEVRGTLQGMLGFLSAFLGTVSLNFYPTVLFNYDIRTMLWCFTGSSILLVFYAVFILPETKGRTLNEIQKLHFGKKFKISPKV